MCPIFTRCISYLSVETGNPCSEKVFVGEFTTDSNGDSTGKVRDCGAKGDPTNTPSCVNRVLGGRSTVADISSLAVNGGTFLVYSRGPWSMGQK